MSVIDIKKVKREVLYWLRNSDIYTITQRSVTTDSDTGTFAADSTHIISSTSIKNIRDITVAAVPLQYGIDYDYDVDFDNSGTVATKITFTAAQTGAYTINYDYGSDIIFSDFPRPSLSQSDFPRLGFDLLNLETPYGGFGNVLISSATIQMVVYDFSKDSIDDIITAIRTAIIAKLNNAISGSNAFYHFPKFVRPSFVGPTIPTPKAYGQDKLVQKNIDMRGDWKYEIN